VLTRLARERLVTVDDFVTAQICGRIAGELEFTWWRESRVVNREAGQELLEFASDCRVSWGAVWEYFSDVLRDVIAEIEEQACERFGLDRECLESWQAVKYDVGGHFDLHHDGGLFGTEIGGERRTTLLLYVEAPASGGETWFPDLRLCVEPKPGRLVVWRNLTDDGWIDQRMRHQAMPLVSGRKLVLTTWEREKPVRAREE
jgi:prolyl 4-hydroxylase